ncbi:carotenoid oxygenase family protein [Nocardia amamiensis]|uniref:Dioxygenase n=1 Tax=Nocardia amamiensis TaxID=404578 RepID=A0ABS0D3B9_9NOCA|nr:carotenoid oxygenase family protein [Nocardia amamiensis]MBF6302915.1 carotenoid oxygenase family protein [Nocardia amamiensis]
MSKTETTTPSWLTGHLAPVPDEIEAFDLPLTGALPAELSGRYFRNGPNPLPGQDSGHWFAGHGMIHGLRLRGGRAEWYRNRWVRTRRFTDNAPFLRDDHTFDRTAVSANTHVIAHGHRILALAENGFPYEVSSELDTIGPRDFDGHLTTPMTAHPKRDPDTGELLFFGYSYAPPYLTYHRLTATGELVESRVVDVPGPTMMHDFAITRNHVVWLDLPVVFDPKLLGGVPFRWDNEYSSRLGVMPRRGNHPVRWYDIDPCYIFHVANAHEDAAGRIVFDAVRYGPEDFAALWTQIGGSVSERTDQTGAARLHRWTLDPVTGQATEVRLDDRGVEFPTHDDTRTGYPNRFVYAAADTAIVKYDVTSGRSTTLELAPDLVPGEAVFVPAAGAHAEDEGWLLSIVSDRAGHGSELLVLDATDLSHTASVHLPRRVPAGFHGSWIPDNLM